MSTERGYSNENSEEEAQEDLVQRKYKGDNSLEKIAPFSSYLECKYEQCENENLREHYHCYAEPCYGKALCKKEEIIRHLKWHKKRNESINYGFLRFSASDDCSKSFPGNCYHNQRQTHYHCFQQNCDKIYVSTSDVQMHSNYHRKDTAIIMEGFQRFRSTEDCKTDHCLFRDQKTTHFHCIRDTCKFTFKNKADIEKHKTFHIKDLQLIQDGFKKVLKNDPCPFESCQFSQVCNHIHCMRKNCHYVLHSSGQLSAHKRKHERFDNEELPQSSKKPKNESESLSEDSNEKDLFSILCLKNNKDLNDEPLNLVKNGEETKSTILNSVITKKEAVMKERITKKSQSAQSVSTIENFFNRKRGRPPKNRFVQVYGSQSSSQAIFTSFKLEKNAESSVESRTTIPAQKDQNSKLKFKMFEFNEICSTTSDPCPLEKSLHFHCNVEDSLQKACTFITKYGHLMDLHIQSTHSVSGINTFKMPPNCSPGNEDNKLVKAAGTYFPTEGNGMDSSSKISEESGTPHTIEQPVPPSFPSIISALHFAHFTRNLAMNLSLPHMAPLFGLPNNFQAIENVIPITSRIEPSQKKQKDDCVPPGYRKFRFNENCQSLNCTYRNNQSHFHCIRGDCNYSFCDKTRFLQHSARHEKLDTLMGEDFKQFRSNMRCNMENCIFFQNFLNSNNKSSHFHCLKCEFICTDTNKVLAHRRQHEKQDFIQSSGFIKISSGETCFLTEDSEKEKREGNRNPAECVHSLKQTHYHCGTCSGVVLSRSLIPVHKHV
ncbi:CASZ1 family protein [Megaselia abdita]